MSRRHCAAAAVCAAALGLSAPSWGQAIVINEVDYDQDSFDTAEFIELKNTDAGSISLIGLQLELINGTDQQPYRTIALPDVVLAAGDYFVVCGNGGNVANCDLIVAVTQDLVQNGSPDAIALVNTAGPTILDTVSYEGDVAGFVEGSGVGLEDTPDPGAAQSISRSPDGNDTGSNNTDFVFACATPGEANQTGPCCGNGDLDTGEVCDDGGANGTTECGCQNDCQLAAIDTSCGSATDDDCTDPDTCDGAGNCLANDAAIDTSCGDQTDDDCTDPDTCDGAGVCLDNHAAIDTSCGDQTDDDCTDPDTCDGAGLCLDNHAALDASCGDQTDDDCTDPDTCDGAGVCLDNHEAATTACGSATDDECTDPDQCDGSGVCLANNEVDGTLCDNDGDSNDCTGRCATGVCAANNRPIGTACGNQAVSDCDLADSCDGAGTCLTNFVEDGTTCTDDNTFCNGLEICALGNCVSDGDPCDPRETCDEDTDVCVRPECGNGSVDPMEECDDFNFDEGDGCFNCRLESGWACGDDDGDGTSDCEESCGDGVADAFESCDDANLEEDDGCDDHCQVEAGFECEVVDDIDVCVTICGDGITVGGEACDDGNASSGDGCDDCAVEDDFVCDRQSPSLCAPEDLAGGCGCRTGDGGNPLGGLLLIAVVVGLARPRRGC